MTQTPFTPSIISRPTYAQLQSNGGSPAVLLAEGAGAAALLDLFARDASVLDRGQIFFVTAGSDLGPKLRGAGARAFHQGDSYSDIQVQFQTALNAAPMGTSVYLAGGEGIIGQATSDALAAGIEHDAIQAEHRGSIARRMQCVHCKGITENVTTDPFTCSNCGLTLFVRDHYSRRLGAFQGVCVDAETPGVIPEQQEIQL